MKGPLSQAASNAAAPAAAPLQAPPIRSRHFNGTVLVEGRPVQVINGVANFNGQTYYVSDDGKLVVDKNMGFIGIIHNGRFVPATPELVHQLSGQGLFQHEQPQSMAP